MGFTKLFGSIVQSSIWTQSNKDLKLVWVTMLALADKHGVVDASIPGLAQAAGVDIDSCADCLAELKQPDKYSRTKEHEGRRIEETDGGWLILNHSKYRALFSTFEASARRSANRSSNPDSGHFHLISDGNGRVKIGFSRNAWSMLSAVKKKFPQARMMQTVVGEREQTSEFLKQFASSKLADDWYRYEGVVEDFLRSRPQIETKSAPDESAEVPSFEEVSNYAGLIACPPEVAKKFYDHYEGNNMWLNRHNRLIKWRHLLNKWREDHRDEEVRGESKKLVEGARFLSAEAREKLRAKLAELEDKVLCHPGRRSTANQEQVAKYNEFMAVVRPEINSIKEKLAQ